MYELQDASLCEELDKELSDLEVTLDREESDRIFQSTTKGGALCQFAAGQGGIEAQDWANMLLRMVERWAEQQSYHVTILEFHNGKTSGIKSALVQVEGERAFALLNALNGVHRIMRNSPYSSKGQRQTSFASIAVLPVAEEQDHEIRLDPSLLKRETFCSGGKGGQHVNKTETAVRFTYQYMDATGKEHLIVAASQQERSQYQNAQIAMRLLVLKIQTINQMVEQERHDEAEGKKLLNSWSSQIISYSFQPYTLVKDHRSGFETSDVYGVMDGDLMPLMMAWLSR